MIDEPITIAERFATATHSSDLTPRTNGKTDADVLLAAAIAASGSPRKNMALALYRVKVTGDKTGLPRVMAHLEDMLLDRMHASGGRTMTHRSRQALLIDVLRWWFQPGCAYCGGTGKVILESAAMATNESCSSCHGRGNRPLAREVPAQQVKLAEWVVDELNAAEPWIFSQMALLLNQNMSEALK